MQDVLRDDVPCFTCAPTIHKHIDGGYVWTECRHCGPDVPVDEDGCCLMCGMAALRYGAEPDSRALSAHTPEEPDDE